MEEGPTEREKMLEYMVLYDKLMKLDPANNTRGYLEQRLMDMEKSLKGFEIYYGLRTPESECQMQHCVNSYSFYDRELIANLNKIVFVDRDGGSQSEEAGTSNTNEEEAGTSNTNEEKKGKSNTNEEEEGASNTNDEEKGTSNTNDDEKVTYNANEEDQGSFNTNEKEKGITNTNEEEKGTSNTNEQDKGSFNTNEKEKGTTNTNEGEKGTSNTNEDEKPKIQDRTQQGHSSQRSPTKANITAGMKNNPKPNLKYFKELNTSETSKFSKVYVFDNTGSDRVDYKEYKKEMEQCLEYTKRCVGIYGDKMICFYCAKDNHILLRCEEFAKLDVEQRTSAVESMEVCQNCLCKHGNTECPSNKRCLKCIKGHHTLLHRNV